MALGSLAVGEYGPAGPFLKVSGSGGAESGAEVRARCFLGATIGRPPPSSCRRSGVGRHHCGCRGFRCQNVPPPARGGAARPSTLALRPALRGPFPLSSWPPESRPRDPPSERPGVLETASQRLHWEFFGCLGFPGCRFSFLVLRRSPILPSLGFFNSPNLSCLRLDFSPCEASFHGRVLFSPSLSVSLRALTLAFENLGKIHLMKHLL